MRAERRSPARSLDESAAGPGARERGRAGETARAHTTRTITYDADRPVKHAFMVAFGRRLRRRRQALRLTQDCVAARCFLRAEQVSKLEQGCTMPDLGVLLLLADALDVSLQELTDGLATPIRAATRGRILAIVAEHPGSSTATMAQHTGLPISYVLQIARHLAASGQIERTGGGWRLRATDSNQSDRDDVATVEAASP